MEPEEFETDDIEFSEDENEDLEGFAYDDVEPVKPPPEKEHKIKLTDLPNDIRFINVIHKETYETRRMTLNQFENAKIDGWMIDKSIHRFI